MNYVAVDLGYGFVKAISSNGKSVLFPSLVGKGYERSLTELFGKESNDLNNIHVTYKEEQWFVGELAHESGSISRVFERERFNHLYTHIMLNVAIQAVTDGEEGPIVVCSGLPLDFYEAQAKNFEKSITGVQPVTTWHSGSLKGRAVLTNIEKSYIFPQGASAIFSALVSDDGKFNYPQFMKEGALIALIDIGFRTTDFIVVEIQENHSFKPRARFIGTVEEGVSKLYRDVHNFYKAETGGADLSEDGLNRAVKNGEIFYKGKPILLEDTIDRSKRSITANIVDRVKLAWGENVDNFHAIFLAGGGGEMFEPLFQPHFDNRLLKPSDSQFANARGYLQLGKAVHELSV